MSVDIEGLLREDFWLMPAWNDNADRLRFALRDEPSVGDLRALLDAVERAGSGEAALREALMLTAQTLHSIGLCRTPTSHTWRGHEPDAERLIAALAAEYRAALTPATAPAARELDE